MNITKLFCKYDPSNNISGQVNDIKIWDNMLMKRLCSIGQIIFLNDTIFLFRRHK